MLKNMSRLYFEIFDSQRKEVFDQLAEFRKDGVLAGGSAVALLIGHRLSYDFDIFTPKKIPRHLLLKATQIFGKKIQKLVDTSAELSFLTDQKIKVSFVHFPFLPLHRTIKTKSISLYDLQDLASNKAYVIGRRGEYRDYVDLFFMLKRGLKLRKIIKEAQKRFQGAFSERLFLQQLTYFEDLKDFKIDFVSRQYQPEEIQQFFAKEIKKY